MAIPAHLQEKINRVQELYSHLDNEIADFKKSTSLDCSKGCGRCCENPAVFVTVLEVLPLACELWNTGQAQGVLEKIRRDREGWCNFYQPDPAIPGNGRCLVYPWRPLVCRMFGFAVRKDKYGQSGLVTCQTMKKSCASEFVTTEKRLNAGTLRSQDMQAFAMRIFDIDPFLGKEQLPINEAIAVAIEKIGLLLHEPKI